MKSLNVVLVFVCQCIAISTSTPTDKKNTVSSRSTQLSTIFVQGKVGKKHAACFDVQSCFTALMSNSNPLPWQQMSQPPDLDAACGVIHSSKACYKQKLKETNCTSPSVQTIAVDSILASFEYICTTEGRAALEAVNECYVDNNTRIQEARYCSYNISAKDPQYNASDFCSHLRYQMNCIINVTKTHCGPTASNAVSKIIAKSIKPYEAVSKCSINIQIGDMGDKNSAMVLESWGLITLLLFKIFQMIN